ncbi:MAG: YggS family pyridoxal phosphate-dependent enzyme [Porticoccaceae bacterium]|nr:YggS family pyridoxal phosphate-dependent enzyme [Porticoccaceae bacterium]MBT7566866.1 YggS family pyridoxal phosphate-dependent enzyme [Porticoccaceae bacterium]
MQDQSNRIAALRSRLKVAAAEAQRPVSEVTLLAVSKTRTSEQVTQANVNGLTSFGENYLQEALKKVSALKTLILDWHFIGPIQSNKTRQIAEHFSWVHSVDRLKIAQRLSAQRPTNMPPLNICLQVNIDDEPTKAGFEPSDLLTVVSEIARLPNLRLRGLMAMPEARKDKQEQRIPFRQLRKLRDEINQSLDNSQKLDTLSMGMSADLEAAILEGATIVRVGTDIFGPRSTTAG